MKNELVPTLEQWRIERKGTKINESKKDDIKLQKILDFIKEQIDLDLELDDKFPGIKKMKSKSYFNIVLDNISSDSLVYDKLNKYANEYELIKILPNGYKRASIFIEDKLEDLIK